MPVTPEGTTVCFNGKRYIVTADRNVHVENDQANNEWRKLPINGSRAAAVRHQARCGYTS